MRQAQAQVFTTRLAWSSGFPFKVVPLEGTLCVQKGEANCDLC